MVSGALITAALLATCANYPLPEDEDEQKVCVLRMPKLLQGRHINIVTLNTPPISGVQRLADGSLQGAGTMFELVKILKRHYGFTYNVSTPSSNVLGGNSTGIIAELAQGRADVAAAMLPVFPMFGSLVRYSVGLLEATWVVLLKRPQTSASGSGLLAPFDETVWYLILAALVCVGPVVYVLLTLRWWLARTEDAEASAFSFGACVWFVFGALMKQGSTLSPTTDSSRVLFATWWIFITILTSFYTANLTAFLTLSKFTLPIKDAKDIARYRYRWMAQEGGALEHLINTDDSYSYLRTSLRAGYGVLKSQSDKEMLREVEKTSRMYLHERLAVEHLIVEDYQKKARDRRIEERDRCTFVMTPDPFMARTVAFAYRFGTDVQAPFDKVLQWLVETGIVKHIMRMDLPGVQICPLDLGSKERQLRNADLWMTYMVVITGFSTSIAVFVAEMVIRLYRYCQKRELEKHADLASQYPGDWKSMAVKKSQLLPYGMAGGKQGGNPGDFVIMNAKDGQPTLIPVRGPESNFMFQYTA